MNIFRQWNHLLDADVGYRKTIDKAVNNTGEVIVLLKDVVRINAKMADGVLDLVPSERKRKEALDRMEQRLSMQEKKNRELEALQNSYLDEIEQLSRSNLAAKEDVFQLKKELAQVVQNYEDSNIQMLEELKKIDVLSINQAIEIISLRSLLPKLTSDNGRRLLDIIKKESEFNGDVKLAAEAILKVLDNPDVIPMFIGRILIVLLFIELKNNGIFRNGREQKD